MEWYDKWDKYEREFIKEGIKIIYFPYTKGISSTKITEALKNSWLDKRDKRRVDMVDKIYCMSSYLALRYIERDGMDFFENCDKHKNIPLINENNKVLVNDFSDIDVEIEKQIHQFCNRKKSILLSGGMDRAIVCSYLSGSDAYTFRFLIGDYQKDELTKAEFYANQYNMKLHYVDIDFNVTLDCLDLIMKNKCSPVISIEPQIYKASIQAMNDGVEIMFVGESSDLVFGGMDKLLSKD